MLCCRTRTLIAGATLACVLVLAGCSRKADEEEVQRPASQPTAAPTTELSSGPAEEPPAESSLSIKRGIVTAAGDHATYRACDDKAELWLVDEADGTLTQLLTEEDASTLYVEAYGERSPVPDTLPAARGQAGVFVLEQLLYAGTAGEMRGCEQPAADYVVAARGNEPFWSVNVTESGMVWKQPDAPEGVAFGELQAEDAEGTVSYRAVVQGRKLELEIDATACRDSMSGEFFAFSARATLDGKEFKGCARVGKQDAL